MMFPGGVNVGGVSSTVILNEPDAERPPESVTVQFTRLIPKANSDPDGGPHTAGIGPSSLSLPFATKSTTAPAALEAIVVISEGGAKDGAVFASGAVAAG